MNCHPSFGSKLGCKSVHDYRICFMEPASLDWRDEPSPSRAFENMLETTREIVLALVNDLLLDVISAAVAASAAATDSTVKGLAVGLGWHHPIVIVRNAQGAARWSEDDDQCQKMIAYIRCRGS